MNFKNKIIVVTGAGKGIGNAFAKKFQELGAILFLIEKDEELLEKLSREFFSPHIVLACDLTNFSDIELTVEKIRAKAAHVDILLNNAGIGVYAPLKHLSVEDWLRSFDVNVHAPFLLIKSLEPLLLQSPESYVINIGSGCGIYGTECRVAYSATKFALRGLSLSLFREYENTPLHVTHVALGSVKNEFAGISLDEKQKQEASGKKYLEISDVVDRIVAHLAESNLAPEIELYPAGYIADLKKCTIKSVDPYACQTCS